MNENRTLLLLRHGKSSWDDHSLGDFDRPLSGRGRRAARAMGEHLKERGIRPGLALVSAARRTRATWELVAKSLNDTPVAFEPTLYEAACGDLLDHLRGLDDRLRTVLLIGHNPGLEHLTHYLVGGRGESAALERLRAKFPTGALAEIDLGANRWETIGGGSGRLAAFTRPADLAAGADEGEA